MTVKNQFYSPMPQGGNPISVNKYHILYNAITTININGNFEILNVFEKSSH
jgi:hypothetical protein